MSTYNLDLPQALAMNLSATPGRARDARLPEAMRNLAAEVVQVLRGALMPIGGRGAGLDPALRQDLGLD